MSEGESRNNGRETETGRFTVGNSGRPRGARNKTSVLAEKLMADDVESVVNSVLKAARNGDMAAARIVLDRLIPSRRDNPVSITLPEIQTASDASRATASILAATAAGEITPGEAVEVARVVEVHIKTLEATEFETRLSALEAKQK